MIGMKSIAILAVCIAMALMIGGLTTLSEYSGNANTTTIGTQPHGGIEGSSSSSDTDSGDRPLPYNGGEVLDSHGYVCSWDALGLSEKIVITGHVRKMSSWTAAQDVGIVSYKFKVYFPQPVNIALSDAVVATSSPISTYESPEIGVGTQSSNYKVIRWDFNWETIGPFIIYIQGAAAGTMTVEVWVQHFHDLGIDIWNPSWSDKAWDIMQIDEANLMSGVGIVTAPHDVVEEGSNAVLHVETGASHSEVPGSSSAGGWELKIFEPAGNPNSSNAVFSTPVADWFSGDISWLVPAGSYKRPSDPSTPAGWDNKYVVALYNTLFRQSHAWLFTIGEGMMGQIPNLPTLKVLSGDMSNGGYTQGGSITVELTAIKNPLGYDVKDFIVSVQYIKAGGGDSTVIKDDAHYAATKKNDTVFTATVTFVVPEPGTVSILGDTYDTEGLNSGVAKLNIAVTPYIPPPPGGGNGKPIDWLNIGLIIGAIILVVGAIFAFVPGVPEPFKTLGWILLLVGASILVICAFVALTPKAAAAVISAVFAGG